MCQQVQLRKLGHSDATKSSCRDHQITDVNRAEYMTSVHKRKCNNLLSKVYLWNIFGISRILATKIKNLKAINKQEIQGIFCCGFAWLSQQQPDTPHHFTSPLCAWPDPPPTSSSPLPPCALHFTSRRPLTPLLPCCSKTLVYFELQYLSLNSFLRALLQCDSRVGWAGRLRRTGIPICLGNQRGEDFWDGKECTIHEAKWGKSSTCAFLHDYGNTKDKKRLSKSVLPTGVSAGCSGQFSW